MTTTAWLGMAAVVIVLGTPRGSGSRLAALGVGRRLAAPSAGSHRGVSARSATRWWCATGGVAATVVGVLAWRIGPVVAVAAAAVAVAGALPARDAVGARTASRRRAELRRAVRVLVAELEGGAVPRDALAAAAEVAPGLADSFRAASAAVGRGDDVAAAFEPTEATRVIGLAWSVAQDSGAALADVLSRVAGDLDADDDQRRAVAVALSGPRSSALLLAGLPVVGIGLGAGMGAEPLAFLSRPGAGQLVCCVGVVLDVLGVLWMRRILAGAQRA